ncbi:hypothetical protein NWF32_11430 [Pseudomonas qingdaonensis]|nr:hypothetical protein [Pseudomonas qingdaonensis]
MILVDFSSPFTILLMGLLQRRGARTNLGNDNACHFFRRSEAYPGFTENKGEGNAPSAQKNKFHLYKSAGRCKSRLMGYIFAGNLQKNAV